MHVDFKLADALCGEGVRNGLALSGVFCPIASVEETTSNGDECVVVVPIEDQTKDRIEEATVTVHLRLQEAISMTIDSIDSSVICDRDMAGRDADELSISLMRFVDTEESLSLSSLEEEP